jgi:hypothetical protein
MWSRRVQGILARLSRQGRVTPVAVGLIGLYYTALNLRRSPVLSPDSYTYSRWADQLLAMHFNYIAWSRGIDFVVPPLTYAGWVTIVAFDKLALGPAWARGILVLNLVLATAVAFMVLRLVGRLTSSTILVAGATAAFLVGFELFLWIPYALSDVSFMFLACVVVYLICSYLGTDRPPSPLRAGVPFLVALLALLYRPAALPLFVLAIVAAAAARRVQFADGVRLALLARRAAVVLVALVAVVVVIDSILMSNPGLWPFPFLSSWIHELSQEYRQGMVVYGRPETFHRPPGTTLDYLWLNIDRLRSFFVFTAPSFSRPHQFANIAFFVPVYVGWLVALWSILRSKAFLNRGLWWATGIGTLFVVFFAVFHSLQQIDFDWRYRLPCLPILILLGAIGWHQLLREVAVSARARSSTVRVPSDSVRC